MSNVVWAIQNKTGRKWITFYEFYSVLTFSLSVFWFFLAGIEQNFENKQQK